MKYLSSILLLLLLITSCTKPGLGGKASISGHVAHHDDAIPNAVIYIKYDATEFPGTDVSIYDDETIASSTDAHYSFEGLQKGEYYLYAIGYDDHIDETVYGGVPVVIEKKSEAVEIDIPITE